MFWPKSSRMRPFGRRSTDTGRSTSVSWTGSAVGASMAAGKDSRGCSGRRAQPAGVEAGRRPAVGQQPRVEGLALVESDRGDGRLDEGPVERDHDVLAVDGRQLELREESDIRSVDVPQPAVEADAAAVPAVREPRAEHVLAVDAARA